MLSATNLGGPAFNTRSRTAQCTTTEDPTPQPQLDAVTPDLTDISSTTPKPLTTDRLQAPLQIQRTDSFCKCISKCLSNGKCPNMKYTVLVVAHDKLGHQGATHTYCLKNANITGKA